jgi:hypothetical protein
MAPLEVWLMPFAMFGMGVLVMFMALTLFSEYRKAFMADPMSVMTLEVFIAALHRGGPGYLAVVSLLGGAMLAASGVLLLVALLLLETGPLWRAIRLSLGF